METVYIAIISKVANQMKNVYYKFIYKYFMSNLPILLVFLLKLCRYYEMKLRGRIPNSCIYVSVSNLYIPRIDLPIRMQ